jgi:type I restriction enzyme M protein
MLTIGKEYFLQNINLEADIRLLGQELNPQTYAICKSDMLITGENPENIRLGNSLSDDKFAEQRFDYMITNPPYGVSWSTDEEFILGESKNPNGRFTAGTPRKSDGALLFLQHMLSKMEDNGSRICIVFNGSPLFTGDAGSGESEIRRWIIENDWLEGIVALPDQLFFNTGISTYIWVLTNNKSAARKGKVQLVNAVEMFEVMRKSLGSKRKSITEDQIQQITDSYTNFVETEDCKIYHNQFFGYTKVTVERPLKEDNPQLGIAEIVTDRRGNARPDTSLRDTERIPLTDDIDQYYQREVAPHVPDSWMDRKKDKVGYEINFTKYFYKYQPLRSLQEIEDELLELEAESEGLLSQVLGL